MTSTSAVPPTKSLAMNGETAVLVGRLVIDGVMRPVGRLTKRLSQRRQAA